MRAATAYFAGVGTVAVAIAAGLGGGLLLGDIMSPQQPKHPSSEVTRLEQRSSPPPIQAVNSASQPVLYLPSAQVAASVAESPVPPPQSQPAQPPQAQAAKTEPAEPKPQAATTANAAPQPAPAEPSAVRTAPEDANARDAYAKARDADVKRDARRAEEGRRKAERRQQWAERRKARQRDSDDLSDVEASVRQATEQRPLFEARSDRSETRPVVVREQGIGFGSRGFSLFDSD